MAASVGSTAAEDGVGWDGLLVAQGVRGRVHPEVELLAQVPARPVLRPHVPHAHVVQRDEYRRPRSRIYLRRANSNSNNKKVNNISSTPITCESISLARRKEGQLLPAPCCARPRPRDCSLSCSSHSTLPCPSYKNQECDHSIIQHDCCNREQDDGGARTRRRRSCTHRDASSGRRPRCSRTRPRRRSGDQSP